jgi:hypothetical protein
MKISQSNILNMVKAVYDLMMRNAGLWENKELVKRCVEKIYEMWTKIRRTAMLQEQNKTKGYTAEKNRQRALLEDCLYCFAGRLKIYAESEENVVVAEQMSVTKTGLKKLSLNNLITKAELATETAQSLMPIPEVFELDQDSINELTALSGSTEEKNAHRDMVYGEHSEHTASLKRQFDALRKEMKRLDTLVEAYIGETEFVSTYFFTRKVYDLKGGGNRKKDEGDGDGPEK